MKRLILLLWLVFAALTPAAAQSHPGLLSGTGMPPGAPAAADVPLLTPGFVPAPGAVPAPAPPPAPPPQATAPQPAAPPAESPGAEPGAAGTAPAEVPPPQTVEPAPQAAPPASEPPASEPPAPAPPAPAASAPTPSAPANGTAPLPPELAALLELLRDETRRAALLRALDPATPQAPPEASTPQAAPPQAPPPQATPPRAPPAANGTPANGTAPPAEAPPADAPPAAAEPGTEALALPGQLISTLTDRATLFLRQAFTTAAELADLQTVRAWTTSVLQDEALRTQVLALAWKLALVLAAGLVAQWLVQWLLRRPYRALGERAAAVEGLLRGVRLLPYVAGHLLLDLLPILAFGIASLTMIGFQAVWPSNRLIMETLALAYMATQVVLAIGRMVFAPRQAKLRLVTCSDTTAVYANRWIRRFALAAVSFYAAAELGLLLGLPETAYNAIWRVGLLFLTGLAALFILQNRAAVAAALAAPPLPPGETPDRARILLRAARDRVAAAWHIIVILWVLAAWTVWALQIERGFERLGVASLVTVVIIGGAKAVDELARRGLLRVLQVIGTWVGGVPGFEKRVESYLPALKSIVSAGIAALAVVALLETWGFDAVAWFAPGGWGEQMLGGLTTVGLTLLVSVLVWEGANAAIQRQLDALPTEGSAARNARVRTLLPMVRTVLGIVLVLVVGLTAAAQVGINIAPLLAGAGVLGLAIGFGSQTLVRDVITGVFLLLEDAVAVGDVVSVGGLSGVVEKLSIRSIKLRALDGSVHIVPFSAVTTVTNMTRDFSQALVDLTLDYGADTDEAVMMLREIGEEMRDDEAWAPQLLAPLEVLGVDRISGEGVLVRARIMTPPMRRWAVMRELNRRIKQAAARRGIMLYDPRRRGGMADPTPIPAED